MPPPPIAHQSHYLGEVTQAFAVPQSGRNDEIGTAALERVGKLLVEDGLQAFGRHAGAPQHPLSLKKWRGSDHDDGIAAPLAAGFEQQRDVQGGNRRGAAGATGQEPPFLAPDQGVKDGLQPLKGLRVGEDDRAEGLAVDASLLHRMGP